jgi:bifunctional polynucleotide phosphatase/kinase
MPSIPPRSLRTSRSAGLAFCFGLVGLQPAAMAPKRLRQSTIGRLGALERKKVRALSALGTWKSDVPPGLMVFLPHQWPPAHVDHTSPSTRAIPAPSSSMPASGVKANTVDRDANTTSSALRSIVAFDLDSTLITTKSGAKFPRSAGDWKLLHSRVATRLKDMHEQGSAVVIFTNQGGVATNRIDESFIQTRMEGIASELGIPVAIYAATARNHFRKPSVGMWLSCLDDLKPDSVDMERSVYVGDAAGRPAGPGRARDFSDSDRKFAINVGIAFCTPEAFFEGKADDAAICALPLSGFDPREMARSETAIVGDFDSDAVVRRIVSPSRVADLIVGKKDSDTPHDGQILVIMCGSPASGKSSFAMRHLVSRGFVCINQDTLKTATRCIKAVKEYVGRGDSVVVDTTNPRISGREAYIDAALGCGRDLTVIVLRMQTPRELAEHLNVMRSQVPYQSRLRALVPVEERDGPVRSRVPAVAFNVFYKSLVEPSTSETGVNHVGFVEFVPHVDSPSDLSEFGLLL